MWDAIFKVLCLMIKMEGTVMLAILAKDKGYALPLYLECIDNLDYPKDKIGIYIRSNNNRDDTVDVLKKWANRNRNIYRQIYENYSDVSEKVEEYEEHEWNKTRFCVLGKIRYDSMMKSYNEGYEYYMVVDCDNFIKPGTLKALIKSGKDVIGPFLRKDTMDAYSNYHHCVDKMGYFSSCRHYMDILNQSIRGLIEVDVIHCTYLVKCKCIPNIKYLDGSGRHEYVIFSDSCRKKGIKQYLDNTNIWGYLTFSKKFNPDLVRKMLMK